MGGGDHCAVYGCNNDRRYPEKQKIQPHVGILRFYSPLSKNDKSKWEKMINRKEYKVTMDTKVCSNHFTLGYHCKESCRIPTLFMKGYDDNLENKSRRAPRMRVYVEPTTQRKRKADDDEMQGDAVKRHAVVSDSGDIFSDSEHEVREELIPLPEEECEPENHSSGDAMETDDKETQTQMATPTKRELFFDQVTREKNCHRYTGLSRVKLDLVYHFVEEKSKLIKYWKGSVDTPQPTSRKRGIARYQDQERF